ncbi:MAG: RNA pseudouridine synthase [Candidatus Marinimicrobia bacterium]|nr:RNA pseudouridine synthase [Candidatus Neomarinimicrobiota bacterium]
MKKNQIKTFDVDQSKIRIDNYLSLKIDNISRTKIKKLILDGQILVNSKEVKPSMILLGGEKISCDLSIKVEEIFLEPEEIDLQIIYEDEYFVVIDKPAGMVVHPGNGNNTGTLANGLIYYFNNLPNSDSLRPGIVHRLDKDTSGVILVAKSDNAHNELSGLFKNRKIKKVYESIVWGSPCSVGTIDNFIKRDIRNKTAFKTSDLDGKRAVTKYRVLEDYGALSRVVLYPRTGRTHQLRVHMKHIGHPIFSDNKYSGGVQMIKSFHTKYTSLLKRTFKIAKRQMLHASSISFIHPFLNTEVEFSSNIPSDMQNLIKLWKDEV